VQKRKIIKDVRTNCFCASLLRTKFTPSLPIFYVLRKKEENLSSRNLNFFAKCSNEFRSFDLFLPQMPLQGFRFVKMMPIFEIINATDSRTQNNIRIVCLCWLIFDILTKNPEDHSELRAPIYQNQTSFPHVLSLKRSRWPKIFIQFLKQENHYLSAVEV